MGHQIQFSEREIQVIEILIQGRSNKQIALALGISVRAVEFHLSNVYAKLGVSSRTEAALKLSEGYLRESASADLRESTVVNSEKSAMNSDIAISTRRLSMKNLIYLAGGLLATFLIVFLVVFNSPSENTNVPTISATSSPTPTEITPTEISTPAASTREHILEQIRQVVTEYDQAVQAEKKNGEVEFSQDPQSGEETFLFKNESYMRIMELEEKLWEDVNQLNKLYVQVYRDEIRPTPFPTAASTMEAMGQYDELVEQTEAICSSVWDLEPSPEDILVYRIDEGKYLPIGVGDENAQCEVHVQMIEEWWTAPLLAKVNQEADAALIRQIVGEPELILNFQYISNIANAPWQEAALYTDETGTKYYVDIETTRLAAIEPNFPSHPDIPSNEAKNMDELRGIARQFANTNSLRLADLESLLLYEEGCKGDICFFRWDYRNKDWSGTDWFMMPPFLQLGVLTNGQIATYINTLDLFK